MYYIDDIILTFCLPGSTLGNVKSGNANTKPSAAAKRKPTHHAPTQVGL